MGTQTFLTKGKMGAQLIVLKGHKALLPPVCRKRQKGEGEGEGEVDELEKSTSLQCALWIHGDNCRGVACSNTAKILVEDFTHSQGL